MNWLKAIIEEINQISKMGTFVEVDQLPMDKSTYQIFNSRFVLNFKEHENRYKARLVVQAYDYVKDFAEEFYSPVTELSSIYLLLNVGAFFNWNLESWDAKLTHLCQPQPVKVAPPP